MLSPLTSESLAAGAADIEAASAALASRLPGPLAPLAELAYNYRWSWTPGGPELLASVDPRRWELCLGNPVRLIEEVHPDRWRRLAGDQRQPRVADHCLAQGRVGGCQDDGQQSGLQPGEPIEERLCRHGAQPDGEWQPHPEQPAVKARIGSELPQPHP